MSEWQLREWTMREDEERRIRILAVLWNLPKAKAFISSRADVVKMVEVSKMRKRLLDGQNEGVCKVKVHVRVNLLGGT